MNEIHLFAGAGGGILGGMLLGHKTICAVEIEPYCQKILKARQRDGFLPEFPIYGDIKKFNGKPWRGKAEIVAGGFPCQDISTCGKGAGIEGERSGLWKEMARIIREVRPRFAFVENSPALTFRGLGTVLGDLAEMGMDARWGVLGAKNAGAPHKRDRIWILAYNRNSDGKIGTEKRKMERENLKPGRTGKERILADTNDSRSEQNSGSSKLRAKRFEQSSKDPRLSKTPKNEKGHEGFRWWHQDPAEMADTSSNGERGLPIRPGQPLEKEVDADGAGQEMADTEHQRRERRQSSARHRQELFTCGSFAGGNSEDELHRSPGTRPAQPMLGRVAHGVANRMDRIRAIGNGQVPQCAAMAFRILSKGLI